MFGLSLVTGYWEEAYRKSCLINFTELIKECRARVTIDVTTFLRMKARLSLYLGWDAQRVKRWAERCLRESPLKLKGV